MKLTIYKYDPAVDSAPYYVTHEVPYTDKMTVLEAVVYFNENCEYVAYDYNCHGRLCGRCAIMMDGKPVLMCSTPITDADHTIEPLAGQTVVRDLIVDKSSYHEKLANQYLRIRTEPVREDEIPLQDYEASLTINQLVTCMRCGMCDAACPIVAMKPTEYAGPATMVALAYRHLDSYDQADRVLESVGKGLYHCIECGMCDEVCQRFEIDHLGIYKMLRKEAEARGLKPSYAN